MRQTAFFVLNSWIGWFPQLGLFIRRIFIGWFHSGVFSTLAFSWDFRSIIPTMWYWRRSIRFGGEIIDTIWHRRFSVTMIDQHRRYNLFVLFNFISIGDCHNDVYTNNMCRTLNTHYGYYKSHHFFDNLDISHDHIHRNEQTDL